MEIVNSDETICSANDNFEGKKNNEFLSKVLRNFNLLFFCFFFCYDSQNAKSGQSILKTYLNAF